MTGEGHPGIEIRTEVTLERSRRFHLRKKEPLRRRRQECGVGSGIKKPNVSERLKRKRFRGMLYTFGDWNIPRTMKEAFEEAAFAAQRTKPERTRAKGENKPCIR